MPHCLLLTTQLTIDFISISTLWEMAMVQTERSHNFLMCDHNSISSKEKASALYLLSLSHESLWQTRSTLPDSTWVYGGGFSVMHAFIINNTVQCQTTVSCERKLGPWLIMTVTCSCWRKQSARKKKTKQQLLWHIPINSDHCWNILQQIR